MISVVKKLNTLCLQILTCFMLLKDSSQASNWQSGGQDSNKDFSTQTVAVGQPLMWPYSTGTDVLFSSGVFVNPQSG